MKSLLIFIFLTLSIGGISAAEDKKADTNIVDTYLLKAGWEKQNEGWMDPETGVVWGPETGKISWGEAKSYCQSLTLGGKNNWRLPTVEELQRAVCNVTGYVTRTACPKPRDHQKDLWLLNSEKGSTYWASDIIAGDPYNAYYFAFDVEGQQVITSKGDKSKARCVTIGVSPKVLGTATAERQTVADEAGATVKKQHAFYVAPFIGIGSFFTSSLAVDNSGYLNGEFRAGYRMGENLMMQGSIDTGLKVGKFGYPVITTFAIGPEYFFIPERVSAFVDLGFGLLSTDANFYTPGTTGVRQTYPAFGWRVGTTLVAIKWGSDGQFNIPISIVYTGYKSSLMVFHTAMLSVGFMYFH